MYLFFDTETNGLPKKYNAPVTDVNNWPRVIQLAWLLTNEDGREIASSCKLIQPNGWVIPDEKFWIDNGYNTQKSMLEGVPMEDSLATFIKAIESCQIMVAHNLSFDLPILSAEMIRAKARANHKPAKICTMRTTTNLCQLPAARGGYKWPKLEELHNFLFGCGFDGAHDAMEDVRATARCFFELKAKHGLYV